VKSRVTFGGLLTVAAISLTASVVRADAPRAPTPAWLAQPAQSPVSSVTPSAPFRSLAILGLLAIVAGGALLARKRLSSPSAETNHPRLRVLDTVRLADKSHLVLTRVGERCLLLGVTSHSVRRIAWLKLVEPGAEQVTTAEHAAPAGPERSQEVTDRDGFPDLLRQAFAQESLSASADDSPAALIAAKTKDTVEPFSTRATQAQIASTTRSPSPSKGRNTGARALKTAQAEVPVTSLIEAQASGLAARRRR
jgi:flagellar biogenesis protein FliO